MIPEEASYYQLGLRAKELLQATRLLREELRECRRENDRLRAQLAQANVETRP